MSQYIRQQFLTAVAIGLAMSNSLGAFVTDVDGDVGVWPDGDVVFQVRLGGEASGTLFDGSSSWTTVVESGMAERNRHLQNIQIRAVEAPVGGAR